MSRRPSRRVLRANAAVYTGRPCYILGESLYWAVTGGSADGNSAGVMAWCFDEDDANKALAALNATGDFTNLTVEYLGTER